MFEQPFYEGSEDSYYYELEQITGFLYVPLSPADAELTVDGKYLVRRLNEVGTAPNILIPETPLYVGAAGLLELTDASDYFL